MINWPKVTASRCHPATDPRSLATPQKSSWRLTGVTAVLCALSAAAGFLGGRVPNHLHSAAIPVARSTSSAATANHAAFPPTDPRSSEVSSVAAPSVPRLTAKEIVAELNKPDAQFRLDRAFKVIAWMDKASEAELAEVVAESKSSEKDELLLQVAFARWSQIDGMAAFNAFRTLDNKRRTSDVAKTLFSGWILNGSPEEALDCALAYQNATENCPTQLPGEMLKVLFDENPGKAEQLALGLCSSQDAASCSKSVIEAMQSMVDARCHASGLAAGLALISACSRSEWQESLHRDLALRLLRSDSPDEQRQGYEVFGKLASPYASTSVIEAVADRKLQDDLPVAKAWALALPTGEARTTAVTEIVQAMTNAGQIQEAIDWICAQGSHSDFDGAFETLATAALDRYKNGNAALTLAAQVTDRAKNAALTRTLAAKWLEADFETAARSIGPALVAYTSELDAKKK